MYTLIQITRPRFSADAVLPNGDFKELTLSSFRDKKIRGFIFFYPRFYSLFVRQNYFFFESR